MVNSAAQKPAAPLVRDPARICLGVAGKVDENDHPFSWSAIINGFDLAAMQAHADPMIAGYLSAQPPGRVGIQGVRVSHVWADSADDARKIAKAAHVETVVERSEDLIGAVDAVLIPTDRGDEHVRRARPFVEAGVPVFIDKPLCDNRVDLQTFANWIAAGRAIVSCSAMRYSVEFATLRAQLPEIGSLRHINISMAKSWRRYGIHALEAVYPFLPHGGWRAAVNVGMEDRNIVRYRHAAGASVVVAMGEDWFGGFGAMQVIGTRGQLLGKYRDSFSAFKAQLQAFVDYLRTGVPPFDFSETRELIELLIAGEESRSAGCEVKLPLSTNV